MAESFTTPGKTCDVGTIEKIPLPPGEPFWNLDYIRQKAFCDCAFIDAAPRTIWTVEKLNYVPLIGNVRVKERVEIPNDLRMTEENYVKALIDQHNVGKKDTDVGWWKIASYELTNEPLKTENWHRCMRPAVGQPWTEVGAALRNIPKRNGGVIYDFTRAFLTIDERDYLPSNLWEAHWTNPPKYAVLFAKAGIFAPWFFANMAVAGVTGIPFLLIPEMMAEYQIRYKVPSIEALPKALQEEFWKRVTDPIIRGVPNMLGTVFNYVGRCGIGINVPCGIGVALKYAAQCQIDDGSINDLQTPALKAIIRFLAKAGDQLVENIIKIASGRVDQSFFGFLASTFNAVGTELTAAIGAAETKEEQDTIAAIAGFCKVVSLVANIGSIIVRGVEDGLAFEIIIDKICIEVVGFSPKIMASLVASKGVKAGGDYVKAAIENSGKVSVEGKPATIYDILGMVTGLGATIQQMGGALRDLSKSLGGAFDSVVLAFTTATDAIGAAIVAAKAAAQDTTRQVEGVLSGQPIAPLPTPVQPSGPIVVRPAQGGKMLTDLQTFVTNQGAKALTPQVQPLVPPGPAKPPKVKGIGKVLLPVAGGTVGLIGGPPGVLIGAAAGAGLSKVLGFSGLPARPAQRISYVKNGRAMHMGAMPVAAQEDFRTNPLNPGPPSLVPNPFLPTPVSSPGAGSLVLGLGLLGVAGLLLRKPSRR